MKRPPSDQGCESDRHDKELMLLVAQGDESALRELVEKHQVAVYGTITKMLGDPIEAQDLAQQVFLRIYRSAPGYRAEAQFRTWMFTILRNLVFNEHRRRSRAQLVALPAAHDEPEAPAAGPELADLRAKTPEQDALAKEKIQAVNAAILALPEQQRLAVVLRRYDDLSYEEIASILKTTVPAVKSLLFRARETLREALQIYLERSRPEEKG